MRSAISVHRLLLVLTLLGLPFLVGSSCAFFFSSGGSGGKVIVKDDDDDDDDDDDEEEITPGSVQTGSFSSPAIAGIEYASGSLTGVTDENGQFRYIEGETVQFYIGDIVLGKPVKGKPSVSTRDLAAQDSAGDATAINISRLLYSLDAKAGDEMVTVPATVRSAAVISNAPVAAAIEFLEFSDEAAFNNAASQLLAVLTQDYPHTAALLDADSVDYGMAEGEPTSPDVKQEP
jgi:hypothetical protein